MQARPLKKKRPTYPELAEIIDLCCGNLHEVAHYTEHSIRQVNYWLTRAPEEIKVGLMEGLALARTRQKRAVTLRIEIPAFIIPHELKALVSLYYRLSWDELMTLDINDMLTGMDDDPEKPATLRYKMDWADLRSAILDIDHGFLYAHPIARPLDNPIKPGELMDREEPKMIGGSAIIQGVTYDWWHQHILMSWVGLQSESPLYQAHEHPPEVMQDSRDGGREMIPSFIEPTVRLLIKRLETYL